MDVHVKQTRGNAWVGFSCPLASADYLVNDSVVISLCCSQHLIPSVDVWCFSAAQRPGSNCPPPPAWRSALPLSRFVWNWSKNCKCPESCKPDPARVTWAGYSASGEAPSGPVSYVRDELRCCRLATVPHVDISTLPVHIMSERPSVLLPTPPSQLPRLVCTIFFTEWSCLYVPVLVWKDKNKVRL